MAKEVRILSSRMLGEKWPSFEHAVAAKLSEGWTVAGFSALRDPDHGDIVYVLLVREVSDANHPGKAPGWRAAPPRQTQDIGTSHVAGRTAPAPKLEREQIP